MSDKPLTKYLLLLATDAAEVARFRSGGDAARASMSAAGLSDPDLQNLLLDGTQAQIDQAVRTEIVEPIEPAGSNAMSIQITSLIQRSASGPPRP